MVAKNLANSYLNAQVFDVIQHESMKLNIG